MGAYELTRDRILQLCNEKGYTIYRLSVESAVSPSCIKNILYGKSRNPGIVTLKMLCDGLGITLTELFDTDEFRTLEQEIR